MKLLFSIDSAAFKKEINKICRKSNALLNEEAKNSNLENILLLHLNQSASITAESQSMHPGEYDPMLLLIEQVCATVLDGIKAGLSVNDVRIMAVLFLKLLLEIC